MTCPVCGSASAEYVLTAWDRNRELGDERFEYRRCEACGTVFNASVPQDLARWYGGDYHGIPEASELEAQAGFEQHKVELLLAHGAAGSLVEIGPSFGRFAYVAKRAGFDVTGIEMDPTCCAYLRDVVGVEAVNSTAAEDVLPGLAPVDVVCMWHVMEHLPDPMRVLRAAAEALRPGGLLAIGVPNPESIQFRVLGRRWPHLDAPRHLSLIPHATLVSQASSSGLDLVATTTTDRFGRHCNRWGWEYGMRRHPSAGGSSVPMLAAGVAVETLMIPVERTGLRGAAYTVLFKARS